MYFNPYQNTTFFEFLFTFFGRLFQFLTGSLPFQELATDEIQVIVLSGVATSASLVGTFLVLRKMTMLANSISHTILLGIVAAFVLTHQGMSGHLSGTISVTVMLFASLVTAILTTFLTEFLTKSAKLQEDASTGIVFTTLFALGIVLVTVLTRNAHIGAEVVMGNVDALHPDDCRFVFIILALNAVVFFLFFKEFAITTFDPALSRSLGIATVFFHYLLMIMVSITVIGAFRAVGVLMVLAFITGPPLAARFLTHNLKKMIYISILLGNAAALTGVALARHLLTQHGLALSTGGLVVCIIVLLFIATLVYSNVVSTKSKKSFQS